MRRGQAILACLNKVPVRPGEIYPVSAGLVHALGAGCLVAEIQQNSDTTYRVYDWDRVDAQGQSRELHIQEALDVIDFRPEPLMEATSWPAAPVIFTSPCWTNPKGFSLSWKIGSRF